MGVARLLGWTRRSGRSKSCSCETIITSTRRRPASPNRSPEPCRPITHAHGTWTGRAGYIKSPAFKITIASPQLDFTNRRRHSDCSFDWSPDRREHLCELQLLSAFRKPEIDAECTKPGEACHCKVCHLDLLRAARPQSNLEIAHHVHVTRLYLGDEFVAHDHQHIHIRLWGWGGGKVCITVAGHVV